jgi:hypothetical protein
MVMEKRTEDDRPREGTQLPVVELDRLPALVRPVVLAAALGVSTKTLRRREGVDGFPAADRGPGRRALYNREAVKRWLRRQLHEPGRN